MPVEIERKFLVLTVPENVTEYPHSFIAQGYILNGKDGSLRVRKEITSVGKVTHLLTIKRGEGAQRDEIQIPLSEEQFQALWSATTHFLEKVRFKIPFGDHTIDYDMYKGHQFENLMTAEVEFKDLDEANRFAPPEWFGEEKTNDPRYTNANLAQNGVPAEEK